MRACVLGAFVLASVAPIREASPGPRIHTAPGEVGTCAVVSADRVVAGGKGGLIAWDRGRVTVLTAADGLPGTDVHVVAEGPTEHGEPSLWIGSDRGIARLRWSELRLDVDHVVEGPPVSALLTDHGRLWVGTWGGGLMRLDASRGVLRRVAPQPARVASLALVDGEVYVGTADAGLWRVASDVPVPFSPSVESPFVWSIAEWDGRLYLGTTTGLMVLEDGRLARLADADVRALHASGRELLVGTAGDGLRFLRQGDVEIGDGRVGEDVVLGADRRDGTTCVATPRGLFVQREEGPWARVAWPGPPSSNVTALATDPSGALWVGTFYGGVAERRGGAWRDYADQVDPRVNAIAAEGRGDALGTWVGTARGLFRIEDQGARRIGVSEGLPSDEVHALAFREDDALLVGTARGVAVVRGDGRVVTPAERGGPGRSAVWALAVEPDGTQWVGTSRGLYWRTKGGVWHRESVVSGRLPDDWVTAVAVGGDVVWVGTYAGGVARLRRTRSAIVGSDLLGGGNINLAGLTLAGNMLYAATMDGLRWRGVGENGPWHVATGAAPGRDVTAVASSGASLWVASRQGLAEWPDVTVLLEGGRQR